MRYPTVIQKIEREKRQKKCEELHEVASPLKTQRKTKSHFPTRPKDLLELRESRPDGRKGEVLSENSINAPKDLSESRESQPEEGKDEASSSSSTIGVILTETTTLEILSNILTENQELAITTTANPMDTYSSVGSILQRDLWIKPGEASIWIRLDVLGQISVRLMVHRPLYGNWIVITLEFGSHNIIIQYSNLTAISPLPTLLTLELHNPSMDRFDEELQF